MDWLGGSGRFWSICVIEALHLYPILYLNLITSLANIDPALEEAARNVGAGRWTRFRKITLPLLRPGIVGIGATVSPENQYSLNNALACGFTIAARREMYGGYDRYLLEKRI